MPNYVVLNHKGEVLMKDKNKFYFGSNKEKAHQFFTKEEAREQGKQMTYNYKVKPYIRVVSK